MKNGTNIGFESRLFAEIDDNISVNGDVALWVSVLTNLIENAAKYSEPDTRIRVRLYVHQQKAHLQVLDHGHGISETDKKLIFKSFTEWVMKKPELRKELTWSVYCKNIISDMGGDIHVKDNLPKGSIFEITMPSIEYELQIL